MDGDIVINNDSNENNQRKKMIWLVTCALMFVVAICVVAVMFLQKPRRRDMVRIANYDELGFSIPEEAREEYGGYLYYLLKQHFEVPEDGNNIVALVRPETFEVLTVGETNTVKFIIDVEDYEQSFNNLLSWSTVYYLPESVSIECTVKGESKYPDKVCYGMTTTSNSLKLYLPDAIELESDAEVQLEYGYTTSDGRDILKIIIPSCGDESIIKESLNGVKLWVYEHGFDSETIEYKVEQSYSDCVY